MISATQTENDPNPAYLLARDCLDSPSPIFDAFMDVHSDEAIDHLAVLFFPPDLHHNDFGIAYLFVEQLAIVFPLVEWLECLDVLGLAVEFEQIVSHFVEAILAHV